MADVYFEMICRVPTMDRCVVEVLGAHLVLLELAALVICVCYM